MTAVTIDLKNVLAHAQLPALPQSAIRLLELSQNADNGPPEYAQPIEADPGLASQVLRFVNSSYFGFSREVSSVRHAITLVGVRTIKNFALWSAVFSLMPNPRCGPFDLKSLWQDSLRRGLFARALAQKLKLPEAEDVFTAALLQDMAVPLLAKELAQHYRDLLVNRNEGRVRLSVLERERFGWTHADAAGLIARQWQLPEGIAACMEHHADIKALLQQRAAPPLLVSSLAALLPSCQDPAWSERELFLANYIRVCGQGAPAVAKLFDEVDQKFGEFAPLLKIDGEARYLQTQLQAEAALA